MITRSLQSLSHSTSKTASGLESQKARYECRVCGSHPPATGNPLLVQSQPILSRESSEDFFPHHMNSVHHLGKTFRRAARSLNNDSGRSGDRRQRLCETELRTPKARRVLIISGSIRTFNNASGSSKTTFRNKCYLWQVSGGSEDSRHHPTGRWCPW